MRSWILGLVLACLPMTAQAAGELTGTLKRIAESGSLRIGYRPAEPPMSFVNQAGEPVGYSIDLCNRVAEAVKEKLERPDIAIDYVSVTAETRFKAIETGEIDILCGATTKTLGRSEWVDFTQLTFVTGASLLALQTNKVLDLASLQGERIAVVQNTTTIEALKRALKEKKVKADVIPVVSAAAGMTALDKGDVAAFSSDQVVLIGLVIARKNQRSYRLADELFSFEPFALAVARNDADFRLVADRALSRLYRSGEIESIYQRWFSRYSGGMPVLMRAMYQLNSTPD